MRVVGAMDDAWRTPRNTFKTPSTYSASNNTMTAYTFRKSSRKSNSAEGNANQPVS